MLRVITVPNRRIEYWTGWHCHLGDNICRMQWADYYQDQHPEKQVVVFGHRRCDCGCNAVVGEQMKQVLDLMDTNVLWTNDNPGGGRDLPMPYLDSNILYRKACGLPTQKKNHITTQFHVRGGFEWEWRSISGDDMNRIMHCLRAEKVYNLSDHHVRGTQHFHGSLREKLDLIATARLHITLDSGTAHLASMTKTTTVAICPLSIGTAIECSPT